MLIFNFCFQMNQDQDKLNTPEEKHVALSRTNVEQNNLLKSSRSVQVNA